ncbi:MAG: VWA domain-containing protein [Chloroflexi bacterium]|nr:VWA domain-containing protein [Chloroflexota bacterium]
MTSRARPDRRYIRAKYRSNRFVLVEIEAPEARRRATREPLNVSFVLDRSGSMGGQKIDLARQAIAQGIAALHDEDRFSVVAYDDQVDVVVEATAATSAARREALQRVKAISARGSTNLFEGWLRGCEQVAGQLVERDVNRCLLLSDGLANIGVTDPGELEKHALELRRRGVSTWTFGVGADFDHALLERMAVAGGGQSVFIEHPQQIPDYVTSAVGEALDVVLRDVRVEVDLPDGTLCEPLGLFAHRSEGNRTVVEVQDLVSGQQLELVLRFNFPFGETGQEQRAVIRVVDRDGLLSDAGSELAWTYADDRTNDLQERDVEVDRVVCGLFAARARQAAAQLNQRGRFDDARRELRGVADRIRTYASSDPVMLGVLRELELEERQVAAPLAAMAVKEMHFRSSYTLRSRDFEGKAKR